MIKYIVCQLYYCKIDFKVKFIWEKDVFGEMACKNFWNYLIQYVEDDNQH